ncbi:MAG: hypothetical protein JWO39_199 [Gemmatimonadetes bacterium]|nr:hypothetical protein [Gemmatimonadota bacterium]
MSGGWRRYLRPIRANLHADVDNELRFHLEMLSSELIAGGMHPSAARAEAARRFGDVAPVRDACLTIDRRRERRVAWKDRLGALVQDVHYALRSIRLAPGFSAIVAITLALGIGATTTMYSVIDGVLLRPLPYPSANRLVAIMAAGEKSGEGFPVSFPDYKDWKQRSPTFLRDIGTWFATTLTLVEHDSPEVLDAERMSASVPRMLGVKPVLGRFFTADEDDAGGDRVVVLSQDFWRQRFNGDPGIVGRVLQMDGRAFTVVGVYPSGASARLPNELVSGAHAQIWLPLRLSDEDAPRDLHFLYVMGQARTGVSIPLVISGMRGVARALIQEHVTTNGIAVKKLNEQLTHDAQRPLTLLLGAVALLLLISCANVANLLLARAAARRREFAIRLALGAPRSRIVTQLLIDSMVRAIVGGAAGIALALGASWWLRHRLAVRLPRFELVSIDARVLVFALLVSIATGLLFGLVPALRASRGHVREALQEGGRGLSGSIRHDRFRRALIVGEIALSFILLVQAGLLIRSLENVLAVPKGFDASRLVSGMVYLPASSYPDTLRQLAYFEQLLERTRALPGVQEVGLTSSLPIEGGVNGGIGIEGREFAPNDVPMVEKRVVSAGYLKALGASIRSGRLFDERDAAGAPPSVIVNESFVRRWMPNEDAVGKRVDFKWETQGLQTIVGVIADMREGPLNAPAIPAIYIPVAQRPSSAMFLVVRAAGDPASLVPSIRSVMRAVDSHLPLANIRTLDEIVGADVASQRLTTSILAIFAALALLLAAVGLYGVISYSVLQRTQELGVRAALGARRKDLMRLVLSQSAGFTIAGIILGGIGALALGQLIAHQLFGVRAADSMTFMFVVVLLALVAALASAVPAFRATRADPLAALRQE